jgi:hypothetical protein
VKPINSADSIVIALTCNAWHFVALAMAIGLGFRTYEIPYFLFGIGAGSVLCLYTLFRFYMAGRLSFAVLLSLLCVSMGVALLHTVVACAIVPT